MKLQVPSVALAWLALCMPMVAGDDDRVIIGYRRVNRYLAAIYNNVGLANTNAERNELGHGIFVTETLKYWQLRSTEATGKRNDMAWCQMVADMAKLQTADIEWIQRPLPDVRVRGKQYPDPRSKRFLEKQETIRLAVLEPPSEEPTKVMLIPHGLFATAADTLGLRISCMNSKNKFDQARRFSVPDRRSGQLGPAMMTKRNLNYLDLRTKEGFGPPRNALAPPASSSRDLSTLPPHYRNSLPAGLLRPSSPTGTEEPPAKRPRVGQGQANSGDASGSGTSK